MTNTFLISSDFHENARCLDNKRLNKQITEAFQVYRYITGQGKAQGNPHPYRAWAGYEKCLYALGWDFYNPTDEELKERAEHFLFEMITTLYYKVEIEPSNRSDHDY